MKIKYIAFLLFLSLFTCQNEVLDIIEPETEAIIEPNTPLTNLMSRMTANNCSADNILDDSNCFSVNLPVTIIIDNITLTINSQADLAELEALLNTIDTDNPIDFVFPITLIFNDYTEIVIENEDQLQNYIEDCEIEEENDIECIDFVYPISFSICDTVNNIIETVTVQSNEALYQFLNNLEADDDIVVSLNFPVTLIYENGETIEVNSNQELINAIEIAAANCNVENETCDFEIISESITACSWVIYDDNNGNNSFDTFLFEFYEDGTFTLIEGDATSTIGGQWNLDNTNSGIILSLSELTAHQDSLEGDWQVISCYDGIVVIQKDNVVLELEQDCTEPVDCFDNDSLVLVECDNDDDIATFNLTYPFVNCIQVTSISYHINQQDAENGVNAIPNPQAFENTASPQVIYVSITVENTIEVVLIELIVEDCTQNAFECYESFDAEIELCDDNNDSFEVFDLTVAFSNCEQNNHILTYYAALADAEAEANPIATPQAYTNTSISETVYVRVQIESEYQVFSINIQVVDCTNDSCSEVDIDAILVECIWNPTNYNGSDNLAGYNFDFETDNQILTVYNNQTTITTTWSTTETANGIILEFSNLAGPNIQALTGEWLVVECSEDVLQLERNNEMLTLTRNCN